jgi:hypothetical protein
VNCHCPAFFVCCLGVLYAAGFHDGLFDVTRDRELEDKLKFGVGRIKIDIPRFRRQKLLGAVTISQFQGKKFVITHGGV